MVEQKSKIIALKLDGGMNETIISLEVFSTHIDWNLNTAKTSTTKINMCTQHPFRKLIDLNHRTPLFFILGLSTDANIRITK